MAESIRIILAVNKRKNAVNVKDNVLHPNTEDLYQMIFKIEYMSYVCYFQMADTILQLKDYYI